MVGDCAVQVSVTDSGQLRIAIADSAHTIILSVLPRDARRWADSVSRIRRVRSLSRRVPREWRAVLDEPGVAAGSMSMTRRDGETGAVWSLFAADREFVEVRTRLEPGDVVALEAAFRRGLARLAPPPRRRPAPRAQRPPEPATNRRS